MRHVLVYALIQWQASCSCFRAVLDAWTFWRVPGAAQGVPNLFGPPVHLLALLVGVLPPGNSKSGSMT